MADVTRRKFIKSTGALAGAAILGAADYVANVQLDRNKDTISGYFGTSEIQARDTSFDAVGVYEANRALNVELAKESTVLLKNKDNTLPLSVGSKVTLFGSMSYNYVICGNGSGSGADDANTVLMSDALSAAGLDVNQNAWAVLEALVGGSRKATPAYQINSTNDWASYTANTEIPVGAYETYMTDDVLSGYTDGYAIVTIARNGAEGASPSFDMKGEGDYFDQTYLELTDEEKDLLGFVAARFDHVIVLVNSAAPMELGFLEMAKYNIDAALWIGYPGENGIEGIAACLTNKDGAEPSGRLADIWPYDATTNPSYYNSGYNKYINLAVIGSGSIEGGDLAGLAAGYFDYEEGVYVGYRYYETADALGYFDSNHFKSHAFKGNIKSESGVYDTNLTGSDYETPTYEGAYGRVVQYAFGYGLSYTTFEQSIVSQDIPLAVHGSNSVTVRVTNTGGTYSGKDVIQLYMKAPIGQDGELGIKGYGLEKPARVLVAFQKTDVLSPGESADYTIEFETDDLANFDYAGKNAYVLERGDYVFELCLDSHTVIAQTSQINLANTYVYNDEGVGKRASDRIVATNQADDVTAGDGLLDAGPGGYMSRFVGDGSGFEYAWDHIWDKTPYYEAARMSEEAVAVATTAGMEYTDYTYTAYANGEPYQKTSRFYMKGATQEAYMDTTPDGLGMDDETYAVTWGSSETAFTVESRFDAETHDYICERDELGAGSYTAYDETNTLGFAELDYDDELWHALLNQVTLDEAIEMNANSGWGIPEMQSVGKPYVQWIDGPGESGNGSFEDAVCWVCEVNLSATFNPDLVESMGVGYGQESQLHGTSGAYAPAMNAHRSPFEGRFFEYFSEDPLLAGKIGAAEVRGIQSTGTGVTIKHYALNDDCSSSPGAFTWVNEQAAREIYYRPYELCIKEADARGIMTSVIRIGFSSSSHYGIYVNMTRKEWGFKGYAITDGYTQSPGDFIGANACLFGGLIGNLSRGSYLNADGIAELESTGAYTTNYGQSLLREQVHGMLWQYVGTSGIVAKPNTDWYRYWTIGNVVLGAGIAACLAGAVIPRRKDRE